MRGSDFRGTDRFTVRRQLGIGGTGIVYEVHDRARDEIVALKTLQRADAADIYRLKREFRSLADIAHPNLASLYELIVDDEQCFFTMELVNGVTLVDYVRSRPVPTAASDLPIAVPAGSAATATIWPSHAGDGPLDLSAVRTPAPRADSLDIGRLRSVLPQLIEGVSELHRNGKLHRDIKPSNVLVTPEGRVVILDFGLITDVPRRDGFSGDSLVGTPVYISPEQCSGANPSPASDWYSVGITLYEALTGRVPFEGTLFQLLQLKAESDPAPPSAVAPDVPDDLDAVCMGLLHRDPATRLSGLDALRKLTNGGAGASATAAPTAPLAESTFVGRVRQLQVLSEAFQSVQNGRTTSVYVHGPSGIGKSTLVRHFLGTRPGERVVALRGRCYEHESVPYKALDGVVDSLSRYLSSLPRTDAARLMPRDVAALSRLFPVMLQVDAFATAPHQELGHADPGALRQRAFMALRELLTRIADHHQLIVYIDDFHWADPDSAVLLGELLRPPSSPRLLLLVCFRSEEVTSKPFLRTLVERVAVDTSIALALEPMSDEEAAQLMEALAARESASVGHTLEIAHEAGGNPLLLEELARYAAVGEIEPGKTTTLAQMLERRLQSLPQGSQQFLETLAVCGRPMPPSQVYEACGLDGDVRQLVALLRAARFLRSSGSAEKVEMYHDRIRETLAAQVSPERAQRIHELLAQILVAKGADDPEALFEHYRGAGQGTLAANHAAAAAKKASVVLAFDRAALFYRHALDLGAESANRLDWKMGLAKALENAGRPAEAADMYLEAARDGNRLQQVECQRKAAEQLLIGGHIDRGLEVIHSVLGAVGLRLPRGPRAALASLVLSRARLRLRGLGFTPRDPSEIANEDLLRIDTCWSVSTGLALVDNIRATAFHTHHLRMALDLGEPYRIARGLALEGAFLVLSGPKGRQRSAAIAEHAQALAEQVGHPHAIALSALNTAAAAVLLGQWRKVSLLSERAIRILRDQCTGVTWEMNLAQNLLLGSLLYQGEIREVSRRLPILLNQAHERGNLYFETELRTRMNLVWLAADDPDDGERQAIEVMTRWSHKGFHRQHYSQLLARVQTELYRDRPHEAWRLISEKQAELRRTLWLRVQYLRIEATFLRARCALAAAAAGPEVHLRAVAQREAERIARENMPWSDPLAQLIGAGVAFLAGKPDVAATRLASAADGFDLADMKLYAAGARRRLGTLVGGERGRELIAQADEWFASQEIRKPEFMTRMLAPGFTD